MEHTKLLNFEKYSEYLDFIEECKLKTYDTELVLHKHHIVPTFISDEYDDKIVLLSVEDHIEAHLKLAKCFDSGSIERLGNIRSAQILNRNSIRKIDELQEVYDSIRGNGNPTKRDEVRVIISEGLKKYYSKNDNKHKGKTYEEIYGERAELERNKRKKKTRTDAEYKVSGKKVSKSLKGRFKGDDNPFAQPLMVNGVRYGSVKSACESLKISSYKLYKNNNVIKL